MTALMVFFCGVLIALIVSIFIDHWEFWVAILGAVATWIVLSSRYIKGWVMRKEKNISTLFTVAAHTKELHKLNEETKECKALQKERYDEFQESHKDIIKSIHSMGDNISNDVQAVVMNLEIKLEDHRNQTREDVIGIHQRIDKLYDKL